MSSRARALSGLFVVAIAVAGCGEGAAPTSSDPSAPDRAETPSGAAVPGSTPVTSDGPKIASDLTFLDLGDMLLGAERTVAFPIRNDGTQPLVIRRIETTCGCTFARILDATGHAIAIAAASTSGTVHTLAPGAACSVELHFVSTGQPAARLRKQTRVVTNDPIQSELVLEIEVNLIKAFALDPQPLVFGEIVRGETITKTVHVAPDASMAAVEVLGFDEVPPYVEPTLARAGDGFDVTLTIRGDAPIGYLQPTLQLTTSDARFPRIPVQFAITIKSPVVIDTGDASRREILDFGPIAAGSTHERTIRVENGGKEAVNLVDVRVDSKRADCVKTAIEVGVPGHSYRVKVTLVAPTDAKSVRGSLVLRSDSALMPDKIVPFQAWVTKPSDAASHSDTDGGQR